MSSLGVFLIFSRTIENHSTKNFFKKKHILLVRHSANYVHLGRLITYRDRTHASTTFAYLFQSSPYPLYLFHTFHVRLRKSHFFLVCLIYSRRASLNERCHRCAHSNLTSLHSNTVKQQFFPSSCTRGRVSSVTTFNRFRPSSFSLSTKRAERDDCRRDFGWPITADRVDNAVRAHTGARRMAGRFKAAAAAAEELAARPRGMVTRTNKYGPVRGTKAQKVASQKRIKVQHGRRTVSVRLGEVICSVVRRGAR